MTLPRKYASSGSLGAFGTLALVVSNWFFSIHCVGIP